MHFLNYNSKANNSDSIVTFDNDGKTVSRNFKKEFDGFCRSLDHQAVNHPAFTYDWSEDGKQFRLIIYEYNYKINPSYTESSLGRVYEGVLLVK